MLNLEVPPIKLVQVFWDGLYETVRCQKQLRRVRSTLPTFFSSLTNIFRLLQTECMQVELNTFPPISAEHVTDLQGKGGPTSLSRLSWVESYKDQMWTISCKSAVSL